MFCKNCGKEIADGTKFCSQCGAAQEDLTNELASSERNDENRNANCSKKSRTITALLAFFFGGLGIHRFYVGKTGTGILQILLSCCFGLGCIWALIDLLVILCGNFKDTEGKLISDWEVKY